MKFSIDIDREYFEKNPHTHSYIRPPMDEEPFSPDSQRYSSIKVSKTDSVVGVLVVLIADGVRLRLPLYRQDIKEEISHPQKTKTSALSNTFIKGLPPPIKRLLKTKKKSPKTKGFG